MVWGRSGLVAVVVALVAILAVAACSSSSHGSGSEGPEDSSTDGTAASVDGGADGPDSADGGAGDASINGFLQSLPAWPAGMPDASGPTGDASTNNGVLGSDNKTYSCTTTPYSLTTTPQQIVSFNPNADVMWPGALLQGKPLQQGALVGLPITQRAPLAVSIPDLLAANNTVTVNQPTLASVQQAIGQLINAAVGANVQAGSSIAYDETEAYSVTQAALDVGLSANYLGFSLAATFDYSNDASLHTIVGSFTQNMFTVAVPEPEQPGDLFSGLTEAELNQQIAEGNIGPDNLPVYVASVTYGRILMFSITSTSSATDISAALNAQYSGGVGGASGSADYQSLVQNSSTQIHVATVGGAATNAEAMIRSGDPTQFFTSDPPLTTAVPISYTLRNLGNNSIAAVSETTSYSVQQCTESSSGVTANFYIVSNGNSVLTFDSKGNPSAISKPITGLAGATGIAYDYQDDEIFVTTSNGGVPGVSVFGADGTPVTLSGANWQLNEPVSQIFYDPKYSKLYFVEPTADVRAFTPQGLLQKTYPLLDVTSAIFDSDDLELITTFASPPLLEEYEINGSLVTTAAGVFAGLVAPLALGYDDHHDRVLVADGSKLYAFLPGGTSAASVTLTGAPSGIAYDDNDDEVAVIIQSDGIVSLYTADLSPVTVGSGAFSGLAQPTGIAYRP